MGDGQGEDRFFLLLDRLGVGDGGVPGAASIELQQVVHRRPEVLAAELLQKRDGVPAFRTRKWRPPRGQTCRICWNTLAIPSAAWAAGTTPPGRWFEDRQTPAAGPGWGWAG